MTFQARFSGTPCDNCEERVKEGQEVTYNVAHKIVHVVCPEARDVDATATVCPTCHMALPLTGVCDDCS